MRLNRLAARRGFSLIELMVTLTVAALLMMLAVPAFQTWIADARVRSTAEAFANGVRLAQGESVRRSRTAVVMLTNGAAELDATPAKNGKRWVAQMLERKTEDSDAPSLFLRSGGEAAEMDVTVTGNALICFNAYGRQVSLTSAESGVGADCTAPSGGDTVSEYSFTRTGGRTLKVLVSLGGNVRLCDAAKSYSDKFPDGCPAS